MTSESLMRRVRVCAGALLLVVVASTAAFAESVRVKVERASVWGNTTGTAGVIGIVRRGDVLEVQGHEGRWLFVVLPSDPRQKGYVLARQTEPVAGNEAAQSAAGSAPRRPPQRATNQRPRTPKAPPFVYIGITGQASPLDFTNTDSVTTLLESETRTVDYKPSRRPGFEFAIGQEVHRNLIVSGSLVQMFGPGTATLSAQIPHPIFYATPRTLTGEVTAQRVETALHVQLAKVVHRSRSYQLTVGGGPSIFYVKQDLLDQLKYTEAYPYDSVAFTGATLAQHAKAAFGVNLQADFVKPITRKISWQVTGRYSYGLAKISVNSTTAKISAGQAQVSGGLRIGF